jgi:hypothetical protein
MFMNSSESSAIVGLTLAATLLAGCGTQEVASLDVPKLPETLPVEVSHAQAAAVKIGTTVLEGQKLTGSWGTGTIVGKHTIVTAEHIFEGQLVCDHQTVLSRADEQSPDVVDPHGRVASILDIKRGSKEDGDIALVGLDKIAAKQVIANIPPLKMRDTSKYPLKSGEVVYMFGYGAADLAHPSPKDMRSPYEKDLTADQINKSYTTPWIIGGILLSNGKEGVNVLTGLHDYTKGAKRSEAAANFGDSGGPVVDGQGRLVGILTQSSPNVTLKDIHEKAGIRLTGLPKDYDPSIARFAPVMSKVLNSIDSHPSAACVRPT